MIPVVMSGGSGTRLWPVSRASLPKQFCRLMGEPLQTLTLRRLGRIGRPWVVTSESLRHLTEQNAQESGVLTGEFLFEPMGRNTAAAVALICRVLEMKGLSDQTVGVFPADHLVTKESAFHEAMDFADELARAGKIVTLGIHPNRPETGFGYIQNRTKSSGSRGKLEAFQVDRFHEKPPLELAKQFVADPSFCWNAGIFVFKAAVMSDLLRQHEPSVWTPLQGLTADLSHLDQIYSNLKSISIDYAVMEKIGGTEALMCLPVDIGWSDVGSWDAVAEETPVSESATGVHLVDAQNIYLNVPQGKTVSIIGLSDIQVIDTGDALLILKKGESQKVKSVIEELSRSRDTVLQVSPSAVSRGVFIQETKK